MNNRVLIIGPFPGPPKGISLSNEVVFNGLRRNGWRVRKIDTEHSDKLDSQFGRFSIDKLSFLKSYLECYKIFNSDVVYITSGITFLGVLKYAPFIVLGKLLGKKMSIHIHSDHLKRVYKELEGWKKKVFYKLLHAFDTGIVLSESLRDNLTPFMKEAQIFDLYNFVEDDLILSEQELRDTKDFSEPRLFFLSNLIEEKGINILLQALKKLENEGIRLQLRIAGNKDPNNNVDDMINDLEQVTFLGVVRGKEKQELLRWGNIFCLPTFYIMEGQPISILEAMTFDNLVLTTRHAGIPDICPQEHTIFCEKNDMDDLYLKIKYIVANWSDMQAKAIQAGAYSRARFTEKAFIDNLDRIIKVTLQK